MNIFKEKMKNQSPKERMVGVKKNSIFTPFGKTRIKVDIEGHTGHGTQPAAGTQLGKDRWVGVREQSPME